MIAWSDRRKSIIIGVFILCILVIIGIAVTLFTYHAPSCTDNRQDQGEEGVDCGGPCPNLCSLDENPLKVGFVRTVSPALGRTDIIAYVTNPNANAEVDNAKATIEIYDSSNALITQKTISVTLPPSSSVPVFIPDFYIGKKKAVQAFLTIDPASVVWTRSSEKPILPKSSDLIIQNTATPKITATLSNPTATAINNLTVVAIVYGPADSANPEGAVIAASQTVVNSLPGLGSAQLVFTWNEPFIAIPARVDILPVPQL